MSKAQLGRLAQAAGLALDYTDAFGKPKTVQPDTLRAVLAALDLPAASDAEIAESLSRLQPVQGAAVPKLLTTTVGVAAHVTPNADYRLVLEDGAAAAGRTAEDGALPAIDVAGYHRLELDGGVHTLAVAPQSCTTLQSLGAARAFAIAVQLYSLRRPGDGGLGDFAALRDFAAAAARHGAAGVAISPVHAQFSADPDRFSPYAPSSRCMLNVAHIGVEMESAIADPLVNWPQALRARLARLRDIYNGTHPEPGFAAWRAAAGALLEDHARFEALHAHQFGADPTRWNWRTWPAELQDPHGQAVAAFAAEHAHEVGFHAWLQYRANADLAAAQQAARDAGMPVGLIADLAVGVDAGGSYAWSRQDETLIGLTIGAPPDLLNQQGQDWGLTAFSPTGLQRNGFRAFIEMLRAALRHAGGVRIDHAMGLARLWVLPQGARASEGTYLRFPAADLLRLTALESQRHRAIVLGEDLGTLPEGFQEMLQQTGLLGMRVLMFERDKADNFTPPATWTRGALAMTSTHDVPTVAGWWSGRDIEVRSDLALLDDPDAEQTTRARDRTLLWRAMRDSGAAQGEEPAAWDTWPVVDAATAHVASSACELMLLPIEDALALPDQPNLPGTVHEHPNWRRRLPAECDSVLEQPAVAGRLAAVARARAVPLR
jgi:4-alpha-glucanotransferase